VGDCLASGAGQPDNEQSAQRWRVLPPSRWGTQRNTSWRRGRSASCIGLRQALNTHAARRSVLMRLTVAAGCHMHLSVGAQLACQGDRHHDVDLCRSIAARQAQGPLRRRCCRVSAHAACMSTRTSDVQHVLSDVGSCLADADAVMSGCLLAGSTSFKSQSGKVANAGFSCLPSTDCR
jgi:hypothetical protein